MFVFIPASSADSFKYRGLLLLLHLIAFSDAQRTTFTRYKAQTSMPPTGFEPAIPASEPLQTYNPGRATTGIGD